MYFLGGVFISLLFDILLINPVKIFVKLVVKHWICKKRELKSVRNLMNDLELCELGSCCTLNDVQVAFFRFCTLFSCN